MNEQSILQLNKLKRLCLNFLMKRGASLSIAEDLFQESLVKAIATDSELKDQQKLQSWFMSILNNSFLDYLRRKKTESRVLEQYQNEPELNLTELQTEIETLFCECAKNYINELNSEEQKTIHEHYFLGKTFHQIASETGEPASGLRVKTHRAREKMKKMFGECCKIKKFDELSDCHCE